jgi:hypothetical protein
MASAESGILPTVPRVKLGPEGLEVSALGLGCKSPFNFLEFIEKDVDLEEELKEFECEFECNEVVKV